MLDSWSRALLLLVLVACRVEAAPPERNNGTDPTRPRRTLTPLYRFQNLPGGAPDSSSTFIVRGVERIPVTERWSGSLRLDVPMVLTNAGGGGFVFGSSNVLVQPAAIYTIDPSWAVAVGSQVLFPTASRAATGSAAYTARPGVVVRRMLPAIGDGSFFAPEILYSFDFGGGSDGDRGRQLQFQPTLDWELPRGFFLNLFPSADIRIDLDDGGKLFLPFDVLAGVAITRWLVATVEVSVPLVKDFPLYDFKTEAQIRLFFD